MNITFVGVYICIYIERERESPLITLYCLSHYNLKKLVKFLFIKLHAKGLKNR
jgi:hypothetical protein